MYTALARYYDLIHAELTEDVDFLLRLANETDGAVLELGCGSGRLLIPLARAGQTIVGVDNAPAMLDLARQRLNSELTAGQQSRVTIVEADMQMFAIDQRDFGLAVIPYNTLMHIPAGDVAKVLETTRRHLRADGRLFIDLINPTAVAQAPDDRLLTLERTLVDPEDGRRILQFASHRVDQTTQTLAVTWIFDATPPDGGPVYRSISEITYHYLLPHQLELHLRDAGFRLDALLGDYDRSSYEEASPRLLALATAGDQ